MSAEGYVLFRIGETHYALPALQVQQVAMVERITPVPRAPDFVDGVVYLRGQVVPVVNLRARFGLERRPYDLASRLLVVQFGERVVGLAVDAAREFVALPPESVFLPPEDLTAAGGRYLSGVSLVGDRLVFILDVQKLLQPEEAQALAQVAAEEERA